MTPGMPRLVSFCVELRNDFGEVAQDPLVAAVAQMGRHEVLQLVFVDVRAAAELRVVIILDVHPADAGLHRQVLLESFFRRCSPG